ncbi:MAG: cytochrome ubiquinol oxidase subunit I [Fibrobacteria bacterium]|nr:cytochrome ubiquinol oxidase subunit I [Fibrobacteria bacterium]
MLSRIQFAMTCFFHYLFVPLTLGLSFLVAILETAWVRTGDDDWRKAAKFFGKLFLINFAVGIVTGIPLEFQFGTNWAGYSRYVGDIFGSLLAVEATVAFFLESTFIGVWFFGWKRLSPKLHCAAIWIVAVASNISAFWILVANAWMQHPVGYEIRNGRAELTDFFAVITQKFAILEFVHTVGGAWIVGGFFMLGISAWHIARGSHVSVFKKSFRVAAIWSLVFTVFEGVQGHMNAEILAWAQPTKLAAMEGLWETSEDVPMYLVSWPDAENERNSIEALPIPGLMSFLVHYNPHGKVQGLKEVPKEDRPPILPVFLSFRAMVGIGILLFWVSVWAFWKRGSIESQGRLLKFLPWMIGLPYLANLLGWVVAETGRQPWLVYGLMRTEHGVSKIAASQVWGSMAMFFAVYSLLGAVDFYLIWTYARKGPLPEPSTSAKA